MERDPETDTGTTSAPPPYATHNHARIYRLTPGLHPLTSRRTRPRLGCRHARRRINHSHSREDCLRPQYELFDMNFDKFRYEFAINSGIERFVVVEFQCYAILISAPPGFSKYPNVTVKFQKAILNFNK